jgi:NADH-ubiquinone oxidoreductase chain 5
MKLHLQKLIIQEIIRFSPFNYWLNVILLLVSGLTIFIAGLGANFEFDLKRIITLSTLSQLGLTTISIGLSGLWIMLFWLFLSF